MKKREVKFRIWDSTCNEWVTDADLDSILTRSKPLNSIFKQTGFVFQQYTGLKDINDKEIYEGDIVKEEKSISKGVVTFWKGRFIVDCDHTNISGGFDGKIDQLKLKVVGNILENNESKTNKI